MYFGADERSVKRPLVRTASASSAQAIAVFTKASPRCGFSSSRAVLVSSFDCRTLTVCPCLEPQPQIVCDEVALATHSAGRRCTDTGSRSTHASSDPVNSARGGALVRVKPARANSRSSSKPVTTSNRPSAQLPRRAQALFDDAADDDSISRARFLDHRQAEPVDQREHPGAGQRECGGRASANTSRRPGKNPVGDGGQARSPGTPRGELSRSRDRRAAIRWPTASCKTRDFSVLPLLACQFRRRKTNL